MLHSSQLAAPIELSNDNHEKAIVTREQLRVHFNDETKVITVDTPNGNSVALSDEDEAITLTDQHGNSITMDSEGVTIDASKITLTSQQEIAVEAGTDLAAEAGAMMELKAGATLTAQGESGADFKSSAVATH